MWKLFPCMISAGKLVSQSCLCRVPFYPMAIRMPMTFSLASYGIRNQEGCTQTSLWFPSTFRNSATTLMWLESKGNLALIMIHEKCSPAWGAQVNWYGGVVCVESHFTKWQSEWYQLSVQRHMASGAEWAIHKLHSDSRVPAETRIPHSCGWKVSHVAWFERKYPQGMVIYKYKS